MGAEGARTSLMFLISQANGQSNSSISAALLQAGGSAYIVYLPTGVVIIPVGFYFLYRKGEEVKGYVRDFK